MGIVVVVGCVLVWRGGCRVCGGLWKERVDIVYGEEG